MSKGGGNEQAAQDQFQNVGGEGQDLFNMFSSAFPGLVNQYQSALSGNAPLSAPEQGTLNTGLAQIANQGKTEQSNLTQSFANRGITDPRATSALSTNIAEQTGTNQSNLTNQTQLQQQQLQLGGLQNLMGLFTGLGSTGVGAQSNAASGLGGLGEAENQQSKGILGNIISGGFGLGGAALGGAFNQNNLNNLLAQLANNNSGGNQGSTGSSGFMLGDNYINYNDVDTTPF